MSNKIEYQKPPLSTKELIQLMESRGLIIDDPIRTKKYLDLIGYYRLSVYFIPLQSPKDTFLPNTHFDDVLNLYIFDRKLRTILMDAIERIEIALKASISNHMCLKTQDAHWFSKPEYFKNQMRAEKGFKNFDAYLKKIDNIIKYQGKDDDCIKHYAQKYGFPERPPCWTLMEILSFGTVSKQFEFLETKYQKKIARNFDMSWQTLESLLKPITVARNRCAHHKRMWNTKLIHPPSKQMLNQIFDSYTGEANTSYVGFAIIWFVLNKITNKSEWGERLYLHFQGLKNEKLLKGAGFHLDNDLFWLSS